MHISAEDIIVEIVDPAGKVLPVGESGEIVVTHLATRDFPFIRYRTGDIGIVDDHPCSCGRGLPLLREIQGRSTDFVVAHDGTVMHGLALIYVLRDIPEIASFKIIQESRERVRVLVVPTRPLTDAIRRAIDDGLRARLGRAVIVDIEETDEIPAERSGKFRYVVSHVEAAVSL
jgi:phenylacetate-CoA ligase